MSFVAIRNHGFSWMQKHLEDEEGFNTILMVIFLGSYKHFKTF